MPSPNPAHEPSMEEILASIRQIISEDGDAQPSERGNGPEKTAAGETARSEPETEEQPAAAESKSDATDPADTSAANARGAEVSEQEPAGRGQGMSGAERGNAQAGPERRQGNFNEATETRGPNMMRDTAASGRLRPESTAAAHGATPRPVPQAQRADQQHGPMSQGDETTLLSRDSDAAVSGAFSALAHTILAQNARTLEDLVTEMLRPMLKSWLDDNLPTLVERLVKEEIERVSRGRR